MVNMGTPGHPEGVPHFSNKAMYYQKLEGYRKRQTGFWLFFTQVHAAESMAGIFFTGNRKNQKRRAASQ